MLYYAVLLAQQKHHYIMIMMLCKQKLEEGEEGMRLQAPGFCRNSWAKRAGFPIHLKINIGNGRESSLKKQRCSGIISSK